MSPCGPTAKRPTGCSTTPASGEPGAVDRLLGEFREPLRRVIGLRLDPAIARRVDASDIVQDVLIEANQRLTEYLKKPDMPFHLWLRHLAQDRIIDTHRRHRLAQRRSVDKRAADRPPGVGRRVERVAGRPTHRHRAHARRPRRSATSCSAGSPPPIDQLSDDDREIILMRHHEGLSNQEVAHALGLTEAAASMRYLRALRRLRTVLVPDGRSRADGD